MNFPEKVTFRLINNNTQRPVSNIAVSLILYAHKKNNYYVGPKISDSEGLLSFENKDCIKEINSSKSFYLMDYVSSLEECLPKVSIKIKPRKEIEFAVENMRRLRDIYQKYWDCSEEYLSVLNSADNDKYIDKVYNLSESKLWQNKVIDIELKVKGASD